MSAHTDPRRDVQSDTRAPADSGGAAACAAAVAAPATPAACPASASAQVNAATPFGATPSSASAADPGTAAAAEASAALRLLSAAAFASMASMRVCDPMLPLLATEFGVSIGKAAQTISAFAIAYGLLQLFYGPLGDRYGKTRVISLAVLACTLANLAAVFAPTIDALVALRAVAGAAAAGVIPLTMAWIGDSVPYERRQQVLAQFLMATIFGMIAGQWMAASPPNTWAGGHFMPGFPSCSVWWRCCCSAPSGGRAVRAACRCPLPAGSPRSLRPCCARRGRSASW